MSPADDFLRALNERAFDNELWKVTKNFLFDLDRRVDAVENAEAARRHIEPGGPPPAGVMIPNLDEEPTPVISWAEALEMENVHLRELWQKEKASKPRICRSHSAGLGATCDREANHPGYHCGESLRGSIYRWEREDD